MTVNHSSLGSIVQICVLFLAATGRMVAQYDRPPSILVMHPARDYLYVGGHFPSIRGVPAVNVARCTGVPPRFESMGEGVPFTVSHMALDSHQRLVVAGNHAGRACVARWDGQSWDTIGLPDSMRGVLGLIVDPWGALCVMSSVRDTALRPVLWRFHDGDWTCVVLPTRSAGAVTSVAVLGREVMYSQGDAVWHFDGLSFRQIDGPVPGTGYGLSGFERTQIFLRKTRFFSIGAGGLREWSDRKWRDVSPLPIMEGPFVHIEALATTEDQLIVSRSYHHREIDIGWTVRRLYRYDGGRWFQTDFPYYCQAMALWREYLLTGHTSDESQPLLSIRRLVDIPWLEIKRP